MFPRKHISQNIFPVSSGNFDYLHRKTIQCKGLTARFQGSWKKTWSSDTRTRGSSNIPEYLARSLHFASVCGNLGAVSSGNKNT